MNFLLIVPINQDQLVPDKLVRTLLAKVKSQSDATLALFRLLACEYFMIIYYRTLHGKQ